MRSLADRTQSLQSPRRRSGLPPLALLSDERRLPDPTPLLPLLPRGSLVILRHYAAPDRDAMARRLARACRVRGLRLLVAGDVGLACRMGLGLHLPEGMARTPPALVGLWRRRGGGPLTVAAHDRRALAQARRLKADAALLSPVFPTASHPGASGLGPLAFRILVRRAGLPVYALGGVTTKRIGRLRGSGAVGVATVGGLGP